MTNNKVWNRGILCGAIAVALALPISAANVTVSPTVASGAVVRVRAAYSIADSWENRDVICASIQTDKPFASYTKKQDHGGYMQRHPQYWKSSRSNGDYVWNLDTGGLSRGAHVFMLDIGYWRKDEKGRNAQPISDSQPFYIKVN